MGLLDGGALIDAIQKVDTKRSKRYDKGQRGPLGGTGGEYVTTNGPRTTISGIPAGSGTVKENPDPAVAAARQLDFERRQVQKRKQALLSMGMYTGGATNLLGANATSGISRQTLLGA